VADRCAVCRISGPNCTTSSGRHCYAAAVLNKRAGRQKILAGTCRGLGVQGVRIKNHCLHCPRNEGKDSGMALAGLLLLVELAVLNKYRPSHKVSPAGAARVGAANRHDMSGSSAAQGTFAGTMQAAVGRCTNNLHPPQASRSSSNLHDANRMLQSTLASPRAPAPRLPITHPFPSCSNTHQHRPVRQRALKYQQ
jgi:hypothetical protein